MSIQGRIFCSFPDFCETDFLSVSLKLTIEMDLTGYAGTKCVDQAGLQYRDLPDFACQVLGLRACTTATRIGVVFV